MSEDRKPTWIEMLEKEIADLRSDIENLKQASQRMYEYEIALTEKLQNVVRILETHKDSEATLMAIQAMGGSFSTDTELEEVRKYARESGKSIREAFDEMTLKGILPKNLRNFAEARKMIREML